jgi:hypothetical protein
MAWEISHAPAAWDAARTNLEGWTRDKLVEALTDDAFEAAEGNGQDGKLAADMLGDIIAEGDVPHDTLVDMAVHSIELHMTCDNGGFNFYVDREGYHTVPCGSEDDARW